MSGRPRHREDDSHRLRRLCALRGLSIRALPYDSALLDQRLRLRARCYVVWLTVHDETGPPVFWWLN